MSKNKRRKRIESPAIVSGSQIDSGAKPVEGSTDDLSPVFCLRHLGRGHPLSACDPAEKAALAERLFELSQLTWNQIKIAPRHGQGFEKIARNALRGVSIPPEVTDEIPVLAFRFSGRKPMLGYQIGRLLTLIALDRDFTAYNHG